MSPYYWWDGSGGPLGGAYAFCLEASGSLDNRRVNATFGLRAVINLKADTQFNLESDGTQNNPYIVQ